MNLTGLLLLAVILEMIPLNYIIILFWGYFPLAWNLINKKWGNKFYSSPTLKGSVMQVRWYQDLLDFRSKNGFWQLLYVLQI